MPKTKTVVVNTDSYVTIECFRAGWSRAAIARTIGRSDDSIWARTISIKEKGLMASGRPGVARSIKVLAKPRDYLVRWDTRRQGEPWINVRGEVEKPMAGRDVTRDMKLMAKTVLLELANKFDYGNRATITAASLQLLDAVLESPWEFAESVQGLRDVPEVIPVDVALPMLPEPGPGPQWTWPPTPERVAWDEALSAYHARRRDRWHYVCQFTVWAWKVRRLCQRILNRMTKDVSGVVWVGEPKPKDVA